jgi:hypothetical protein
MEGNVISLRLFFRYRQLLSLDGEVTLSPSYAVSILQLFRFARPVCVYKNASDFTVYNRVITEKYFTPMIPFL